MYSAKNAVFFEGREGFGCNCDLCEDGKKVAKYIDVADGAQGQLRWENNDHAAKQRFEDYIRVRPDQHWNSLVLHADLDSAVNGLLEVAAKEGKI